jgi:hypothetical protein
MGMPVSEFFDKRVLHEYGVLLSHCGDAWLKVALPPMESSLLM